MPKLVEQPTIEINLVDDVVELAEKINSQFAFELNKAAGLKYSIIEDIVLWLNVRGNLKFGQIGRSTQSIKSRKIVLK